MDPFYHKQLDFAVNATVPATEVITEVYVPRDRLADFMQEAGRDLRDRGSNVIYGTVRLIEPDTDTFLAWARKPHAYPDSGNIIEPICLRITIAGIVGSGHS